MSKWRYAMSLTLLAACGDAPSNRLGTDPAEDGAHDLSARDASEADTDAAAGDAHDLSTRDSGEPDVKDGECFAPDQNLDDAYEPAAEGCACDLTLPNEAGYCIRHGNGHAVALVCEDGQWRSVEDGPCEPRATREGSNYATIIMAATCTESGGELGPAAATGEHPLCSEGATTLGIVTLEDGARAACCRAP